MLNAQRLAEMIAKKAKAREASAGGMEYHEAQEQAAKTETRAKDKLLAKSACQFFEGQLRGCKTAMGHELSTVNARDRFFSIVFQDGTAKTCRMIPLLEIEADGGKLIVRDVKYPKDGWAFATAEAMMNQIFDMLASYEENRLKELIH